MPSPRKPTDAEPRLGKRPEVASRSYVLGLLRERCLMPDVPEDVAGAVLDVLVHRGALTENPKGHLEIAGKEGATLDLPEQAGPALRNALVSLVGRDHQLEILGQVVRGSGASGSGAGGPPIDQAAVAKHRSDYAKKALRELEWDENGVIASFGEQLHEQASSIVRFVIERLRADIELYSKPPVVDARSVEVQANRDKAEGYQQANEFRKDGGAWIVRFNGVTTTIEDSPGMEYIKRILLAEGREVGIENLLPEQESAQLTHGQDVMDERELQEIKRRIRELQGERARAEESQSQLLAAECD